MITIFTTPKPFVDNIAIIQKNAIRSWRALSPDIQIVIFGNSQEVGAVANETNALCVPTASSNHFGTPYINHMFTTVEGLSKLDIFCFINADIILPNSFLQVVDHVSNLFKRYLVIGMRRDLDWEHEIDFLSEEGEIAFWKFALQNSQAHDVAGMDYFIYPRGIWKAIPNLLAGRAGFDNWLIWRARRSLIPVIDASAAVFAVHQNHDYSHHVMGRKGVFEGEEAVHNQKYLGDNLVRGLNILDATHKFSNGEIIRKKDKEELQRYRNRLARIFPEFSKVIRTINHLLSFFKL